MCVAALIDVQKNRLAVLGRAGVGASQVNVGNQKQERE